MSIDFEKIEGSYKPPVASWCRTCARRNTCQIKETVAMEQRLVSPYPVKHLEVTIKCRRYIKDGKLPPDSRGTFESIFIK